MNVGIQRILEDCQRFDAFAGLIQQSAEVNIGAKSFCFPEKRRLTSRILGDSILWQGEIKHFLDFVSRYRFYFVHSKMDRCRDSLTLV